MQIRSVNMCKPIFSIWYLYNGHMQYSIAQLQPQCCQKWWALATGGCKRVYMWDETSGRTHVLKRPSQGYYVEVGTQSGEQCNTRYLRVRYGFQGLMVDDNFQNTFVNQKRRRLILSIHCTSFMPSSLFQY